MKIKAFTLAEVLVTLAIIGVVAGLTIPSVVKNVQESKLKSAWKHDYSLIAQAVMMVRSDYGGTLLGVYNDADVYVNSDDFANDLEKYIKYAKKCQRAEQGCFPQDILHMNGTAGPTGYARRGWILSNGASVYAGTFFPNCTNGGSDVYCGSVTIDVNGFAKPNVTGRDVFTIYFQPTFNTPHHYFTFDNTTTQCDASNELGCGAYYLLN